MALERVVEDISPSASNRANADDGARPVALVTGASSGIGADLRANWRGMDTTWS